MNGRKLADSVTTNAGRGGPWLHRTADGGPLCGARALRRKRRPYGPFATLCWRMEKGLEGGGPLFGSVRFGPAGVTHYWPGDDFNLPRF